MVTILIWAVLAEAYRSQRNRVISFEFTHILTYWDTTTSHREYGPYALVLYIVYEVRSMAVAVLELGYHMGPIQAVLTRSKPTEVTSCPILLFA